MKKITLDSKWNLLQFSFIPSCEHGRWARTAAMTIENPFAFISKTTEDEVTQEEKWRSQVFGLERSLGCYKHCTAGLSEWHCERVEMPFWREQEFVDLLEEIKEAKRHRTWYRNCLGNMSNHLWRWFLVDLLILKRCLVIWIFRQAET